MLGRVLFVAVTLLCGLTTSTGASECPLPANAPAASRSLVDWYEIYVKPFRSASAVRDGPPPSVEQIAAQMSGLTDYHRNALRDSLFFESLTRQIAERYTRASDFKGLDTAEAEKFYQRGSGADLNFSMMCIGTQVGGAPDNAYVVTLFGMLKDDCEHVSLRGLVFTDVLVNGAVNGACRANHIYFRNYVIPVNAGVNTVTFVCHKDVGGCIRR